MATTTWIGTTATTNGIPDIGDWNAAADWTNGVPTATVDAIFPSDSAGPVNGDGPAVSLTVEKEQTMPGLAGGEGTMIAYSLGGTHALGTLVVDPGAILILGQQVPPFDLPHGVPAVLSFGSALVSGGIALDFGSQLGSGTITLAGGYLDGIVGTLSNPIVLAGTAGQPGSGAIDAGSVFQAGDAVTTTISGVISGSGVLTLGGPGG